MRLSSLVVATFAVFLSACAVHVPDLQDWSGGVPKPSESGNFSRRYFQDDDVLELLTTSDGKLVVMTLHRNGKLHDFIYIDPTWERGTIVDIIDEAPSGRIRVVWINRSNEEIITYY